MAMSRKDRRLERLRQKKLSYRSLEATENKPSVPVKKKKEYANVFAKVYETQYKKLILIPIILLVLAFVVIGMNVVTTGDFINKAVSLKGGLTLTISTEELIDVVEFESFLSSQFLGSEISVRELSELGVQNGIIIESDITSEQRDSFISTVEDKLGLDSEDFSIEEIGSSLGASFFKQTMIAVLFAFLFMGIVVFWYFRTLIPSGAVILAAFSDIIVTLAIVDIMGMKIGTAGVAAFLMLIGYSVDTDILLSTRVLKKTEGTVMSRIYDAMKTGLTMNLTTMVAVTIGLIVTDSEVIKQIMIILLVGLFVDIINTWIQNVGIIRYYLERKGKK
ncbi:MAG: protein translocase subunit SecF [archaeon]